MSWQQSSTDDCANRLLECQVFVIRPIPQPCTSTPHADVPAASARLADASESVTSTMAACSPSAPSSTSTETHKACMPGEKPTVQQSVVPQPSPVDGPLVPEAMPALLAPHSTPPSAAPSTSMPKEAATSLSGIGKEAAPQAVVPQAATPEPAMPAPSVLTQGMTVLPMPAPAMMAPSSSGAAVSAAPVVTAQAEAGTPGMPEIAPATTTVTAQAGGFPVMPAIAPVTVAAEAGGSPVMPSIAPAVAVVQAEAGSPAVPAVAQKPGALAAPESALPGQVASVPRARPSVSWLHRPVPQNRMLCGARLRGALRGGSRRRQASTSPSCAKWKPADGYSLAL